MLDVQSARMRAYRNTVYRYRRLLKTNLSDLERQFIERRLAEELSKMDELVASGFPINVPPKSSPSDREVRA